VKDAQQMIPHGQPPVMEFATSPANTYDKTVPV